MACRSQDRDPMRENPSSTVADETRLFGGNNVRDPNAVRIKPGQTFSLRPVNTLARGVRSSGPVRANGKEKNGKGSFFTSQARSTRSADAPERSSKRRRIEGPEERQDLITISDDDAPGPSSARISPVTTRSNVKSPTPSQHSSNVKGRRNSSSSHKSEYREADRETRVTRPSPKKKISFADRYSSPELSFTIDAANQRRRESVLPSGDFDKASRKVPAQGSIMSVEIPKKLSVPNPAETPPPRHAGKSRASLSRDSPDELQGDVTVGPIPLTLNRPIRDSQSEPLPSDIRPAVFTSQAKSKSRNKKAKAKKGLLAPQNFKIIYYRGGGILAGDLGHKHGLLTVKPDSDEPGEITTVAGPGIIHSIPLRKILKVVVGESPSRKVRAELSKSGVDDTKIDIELSSSDQKNQLCSFLSELKVELQEKKGDHLDGAFRKSAREHQKSSNGIKRPLGLLDFAEETPKPPAGSTTKRKRLSDQLQDKNEDIAAQRSPDTALGRRTSPSPPATNGETSASNRASTPLSGPQPSVGVEIPVKKFYTNLQAPARSTRSMSRQTPTTLICDDDDDGHEEKQISNSNLDVDPKWTLMYPRSGKKRAGVDGLDLKRLEPDEYLNDNLIGFYIRFLEDHLQRCNPEAAKRVYFFNSYFYEALTKNSKRKGNINYENVEKWTRNVDIFSHDYLVVPINESHHWYLAIICNLPYLEGIKTEEKPSTSDSPGEVEEVRETPEPQSEEGASADPQSIKEESARQSLASMSLFETQESQPDGSKSGEDEWPECEDYPGVARAKLADCSSQVLSDSQNESGQAGTSKQPRKSKKKQSFGQKYHSCQPIIITFDSLNVGRSPTITTFREYLFAEAKSKRDIEIDKSLIKGMSAKEIPLQPNFSDCGLYLLAYLEKFAQNPDEFVRKLLRREMRAQEDWPPLKSGLLRTRLHGFLELLYTEQKQLTEGKLDEDALMVNQQPISYLLGPPSTDDKEVGEEKKNPQVQVQVGRSPTPRAKSKTPVRSREPSAQRASPKPETSHDMNPTEFETQGSVQYIGQTSGSQPKSPKLEAQNRPTKGVVVEVPDSQDRVQANAPPTAALSTKSRSLEPRRQRADTVAVYIDDTDAVEESAPHKQKKGRRRAEEPQVLETPPGSPNAW
ncbi:uncharacterized protein DSM5745_00406 [Aspergillus mulundensis]|uniref:Ubiquitin-like protease family profile domain-containing protein n=1 Tax=Aspergillus mulundensis TaxID=1810919 RepID=A0A3D8T3F8_9EURO|nr:hypothetical protein DSM5745_00406 [Aspergillus mulundensis]RDW93084.1 hypothetical protein DSM5745_00406 [Aspergillus mulundensis]